MVSSLFACLVATRWPQLYLGRDSQARPLVFERPGLFDPRDASGEPGRLCADDVVAYYCKHLAFQGALLREATAQEGRLVGTMLHVIDVSGASLRAHLSGTGRDVFARVAAAADAHFPETLGTLLIINASAAFPMFWGVVKAFVDARTREKIEVFGDPPARDFFAPGGWPARVRQLCGGRFPEEMFPGRKGSSGSREAPWKQEPWRLLGYKGPVKKGEGAGPGSPKTQAAPEAPKPPKAPKAPTRGAALLQHGAELHPLPPPPPPPEPPRAAEVHTPPPPMPQTPSPPPQAGPPAGAAGRLIWEMAQKQVQRAQEKRGAPAAPAPGAASGPGGASADDVARWVAAAAAHEGRERWRPPSSLGLGSAPGSPAARRSSEQQHAFAMRATPPRYAPPPPLWEGAEEGVIDPFEQRRLQLPHFAPPVPASPAYSVPRSLRAPPQIAPEVVWAAALSVADDLGDLFGADAAGGVDVRASGGDAEGWSCAVCGRRFAFRDLPLAQACEAAHAARGEAPPRARRARAAASSSSSSSSDSGDDGRAGGGRGDPVASSPAYARRSLHAGLDRASGGGGRSKWGGGVRDKEQAAEARERVAAAGGVASEWTDAAVLSADDAPGRGGVGAADGSPLRAPLSPGTLAAAEAAGMTPQRFAAARGTGRVETSADVLSRRRSGCAGVPRASCAPPDAAACVVQ